MFWRFLGALALVLLLVEPAYADGWETSNGNVADSCVQFDWRGGSASASFSTPVQITVDNTIANKIGYDGEIVDEWALTAGEIVAGDRVKGFFTFVIPANVPVTVSGKDLGFWAGWYGPRFCFIPIADPVPVVTAEPTPEPIAEPTLEPTPEPAPQPSPEPPMIVVPSPSPVVTATPEPVVTPTVEPTVEPTVAPTSEPTPEVTASPEPTAEPTAEPTSEPTSEPIPEVTQAPGEIVTQLIEEQRTELMAEAVADDPQLPEELATIPVIGAVADNLLKAFNTLGNIGADLTPEERQQAKRVVLSSVIASNVLAASTIRKL
jgi:hypothetical protein